MFKRSLVAGLVVSACLIWWSSGGMAAAWWSTGAFVALFSEWQPWRRGRRVVYRVVDGRLCNEYGNPMSVSVSQ